MVLGCTAVLHAAIPTSGHEVMQRVLARAKWTEEANPQAEYIYNQLSIRKKLDGQGAVQEQQERLYEVFYIEGLVFRRLIENNGQALSAEETQREQQREQEFRRQIPERKRRRAQGPAGDQVTLNEDLINHYSYELAGQEFVRGRWTYAVTFRPRSDDLPLRRRVDRLLNKLAGRVWVDSQDYEIVRLEVHLAGKVTMWGGLLAVVRQLEGEFEQTRTDDGVWFPLRLHGHLDARLLLSNYRLTQTELWSNFRKVGAQNSGSKPGH
jgi:hypothetical protein